MFRKKDVLIVGALLALAIVLHAFSGLLPKTDLSERTADEMLAQEAIEYIEATAEPAAAAAREPEETAEPAAAPADETAEAAAPDKTDAAEEAAAFGPAPRPQTEEVKGYVVLTVGGRQYGDPIAMDRDKVITLKQESGAINKVHITPEKVFMESSTCENQDCVGQGEITPYNYQTRVLSTYVICLPNNVSIEFVPAQ